VLTAKLGDVVDGAVQRRQHAEAEQVELDEVHRCAVVFVPLQHAAPGHRRPLDGAHFADRAIANHHATRVNAEVPWCILHALCQLHHQVGHRHLALVFDRAPRVEPATERVLVGGAISECARHVAHRRAGAIGDHVGDLRGALTAVALVDVLNDFFATITLDVEVDVGWAVAFGRQEPLEEQPERHRIGLGDAERVAHGTVGRTAAPLTEDVVAFAELHDVPHHEEVTSEPELLDHLEFVVDGAPGARTQREIFVHTEWTLAVSPPTTSFDQLAQKTNLAQPVGARIRRQARCDE